VLGEEIATIASGRFEAGEQTARLDVEGLNDGVYFCRLNYDGMMVTQRVVVMQ
jgi:hypothetical protein